MYLVALNIVQYQVKWVNLQWPESYLCDNSWREHQEEGRVDQVGAGEAILS